MNNKKLEASESSYTTYKAKYIKYVDSEMNFKTNDIEFYTALGSEYLKLVSTQSGEEKTRNTAKGVNYFKEVLKLDGNQFGPNLNIGIMYYNNGADLIMNSDPLTPIEEIPIIEAKAQEYFKKAMPYLEKAHQLDPSRIDVIEALTGCCYGLYGSENEEYQKYQKILDEKNLPILLDKHKANPKDKHVIQELVRIYSTTFKDDTQYKKYAEILNKLEE
jgi:tetratricopeptide (TPR) repeat protein